MKSNIQAARSLLQLLPYMHEKFLNPMERVAIHPMSKQQLFALMMLYRKGPHTMTELSSVMQVSKQQLTPLVDRLLQQKMVERLADPEDRRIVRIIISLFGKQRMEEIMKQNLDMLAKRLIVLPKEELQELDTIMVRVRELLEKADELSKIEDKREGDDYE